ncbi:MAG: outer membrane lipoprotein-sorting protein [Candidatus Theseobacter exili]|nr:outer membrane lipoprotein-sorting protein [Candidatus Theseobacter exili]
MKKILLLFTISFFSFQFSANATLTGKQIVKKAKEQSSFQDEYKLIRMILMNRNGQKRKREVAFYSKTQNDLLKSLIRFLEPKNISGTSLLTIENQGRDDDQWIFFPQVGERRITSNRQSDRFLGTDLTYEDIKPEKLSLHHYDLIGEEIVDGKNCYKVAALPSTEEQKELSGYSKRIIWIEKERYLIIKVDFFGKNGLQVKTSFNHKFGKTESGHWISCLTTVKDLERNHKTALQTVEFKTNQKLNDSLFTKRHLGKSLSLTK